MVAAMHMSDGIVDAPTSLLFGALALAVVAVCARRARQELDERAVPLAGLVTAFIFAVQLVNFPVLPGVSGHLLGGTLAAVLVGPFTGVLCISIVLTVQSLLFADGGVTALGLNVVNMGVIGVGAGYAVAVLLRRAVGSRAAHPPTLGVIAAVAGLVGTCCAALGFVAEYAIGGVATTSLPEVAGYLLGTHLLIGVGEGVITALTAVAVARARPELVYLLRHAPAAVPA
ncbi:energy-coupling factor ABC transporter permease [Mycobacterium sp. MYCO198283]|uniref:energy-coupling factor ABC transporter permease n=1 Tax=Mycobacterium sp. MYCO198283 TaxID=2883505 RepID=UPI001E56B746|nr:energy-coupling factor ABC transporter permease [Mycobacterium sp. MYCO198283]MCG5433781.1 energy-coupling factor ABC transporter permease [Mycobacterium sp. MYCO198283]